MGDRCLLFVLLALASCRPPAVSVFPPWSAGEVLAEGSAGYDAIRCEDSTLATCVRVRIDKWDARELYAVAVVYDRSSGEHPSDERYLNPEIGIAMIGGSGALDPLEHFRCANKGPVFSRRFSVNMSRSYVVFAKIRDVGSGRKWDVDILLEKGDAAPSSRCEEIESDGGRNQTR